MSSSSGILQDFVSRLRSSKCVSADDYVNHRDAISKACETANALRHTTPTVVELESFLMDAHNFHVESDSVVKSAIFRSIRLCMGVPTNGSKLNDDGEHRVGVIVKHGWQYLIISSIEREPLEERDSVDGRGGDGEVIRQDFVLERMQALKLVRRIMTSAPAAFPLSFARSLVALSENSKDNIRRVSLETLRELCVLNPRMAVASQAFNTLLDAVFDPSFVDMIESIVNTILFMLSNPISRRMLRPNLDLRALIAPFTDVDAPASDHGPHLNAAKIALVTIMKSYTGLVLLVSDDLGLPTLVRMLRDSKVPTKSQGLLLDAIAEVFEPISAKVRRSRLSTVGGHGGYRVVTVEDNDDNGSLSFSGSGPASGQNTPSSRFRESSVISLEDSLSDASPGQSAKTTGGTTPRRASLFGSLFGNRPTSAELRDAIPSSSGGGSGGGGARRGSGGLFSFVDPLTRDRRGSKTSEAALTGLGNGSASARSASPGTATGGGITANFDDGIRNSNARRKGVIDELSTESAGALAVAADDLEKRGIIGVDSFVDNVMYNVADNYSAVLCSALLHSEMVESLCYLGTRGSLEISDKARVLLIEFLRTLAHILPEQNCAELLNVPSLIEFSTGVHSGGMTNRAHKARLLLTSLAEAFSVAPRQFRVSPSGVPSHAGLSVLGFKPGNSAGEELAGGDSSHAIHSGVSGDRVMLVSSSAAHAKEDHIFYQFRFAGAGVQSQLPLCAMGEYLKHFVDPLGRDLTGAEVGMAPRALRRVNSKGDLVGAEGSGNTYAQQEAAAGRVDVTISQMESIRHLRLVSGSYNPQQSDFMKQLDATRVNGKDGKEPFRWDWSVIYETLEHSFHDNLDKAYHGDFSGFSGVGGGIGNFGGVGSSDKSENRLQVAMHTKWIRRVGGFFRCSSDSKGYFANLPWDLANLTYFECACSLYHLLMVDPVGQEFLKSDRRGMLFNEIASEVKLVLDAVDKQPVRSRFGGMAFSGGFGRRNATSEPMVFRLHSMKTLQAREYFTILGRLVRHPSGQALLDDTDVFRNLSQIGSYPALDFLSRIVITSLVFTDDGFMSKHLIRIWTSGAPAVENDKNNKSKQPASGSDDAEGDSGGGRARTASNLSSAPITGRGRGRCSLGLRNYLYNLLGALLHSQPATFYSWGLDALVDMLVWEEHGKVSGHLVRLLLQVVQRVKGLMLLIEKLENVRYEPAVMTGKQTSDGANETDAMHLAQVVTGYDLTTDEAFTPVLVYFLGVPKGVQYCVNGRGSSRDGQWLSRMLEKFSESGARRYVFEQELCLARALSPAYVKSHLCPSKGVTPIPFLSKDLSSTYTNTVITPGMVGQGDKAGSASGKWSAAGSNNSSTDGSGRRASNVGKNGQFGSGKGSSTEEEGSLGRKASHASAVESRVRDTEAIDLEGMLRVPWNIEVRVTTPSTSSNASGGGSHASSRKPPGAANELKKSEFLKIDSYLDSSDLALASSGGIVSDANCFVKVRGVVLGTDGSPGGHGITTTGVLASTLLAGRSPVTKGGDVRGVSAAFAMSEHQHEVGSRDSVEAINIALSGQGLTAEEEEDPKAAIMMAPCDIPPTQNMDNLYEWTTCTPQHRSVTGSNAVTIEELGNTRFSVQVHGEPCKFIFSRVPPTAAAHEQDWKYGEDGDATSKKSRRSASATASGALRMSTTSVPLTDRRKSISKGSSTAPPPADAGAASSAAASEPKVYLLEVQYYISVLTGQALFAPQPPHVYGMLARSVEGCSLLSSGRVARRLLESLQTYGAATTDALLEEEADNVNKDVHEYAQQCTQVKEALWSLGHIASCDTGFALVMQAAAELQRELMRKRKIERLRKVQTRADIESKALPTPPPPGGSPVLVSTQDSDASATSPLRTPTVPPPRAVTATDDATSPSSADGDDADGGDAEDEVPLFNFVKWCQRMVIAHPSFGVRGTIFNVLGLVSRAPLGRLELAKAKWECSPVGFSSAVAVPRNHAALFRRNLEEEERFKAYAASLGDPDCFPHMDHLGGPDMQETGANVVLTAISNMQGSLFSTGENRMKLEVLRRQYPQAFTRRETLLAVQELLQSCAFRLTDRRAINSMFPASVRMMPGQSV
jgi:hypothetical protein